MRGSYFPAQNTRSARGGDCHQFRAFKESTTYGRIRTRNWLTVPSHPSFGDRMHAVNVSAGQNQAAEAFFGAGLGSELGRPGLQVLEACAGIEEDDFVVWF